MNAANASSEEVSTIDEGHLLRWTKQLAMRGRARLFDGHGVCGRQKLVLTGDYERLLLHKDALFPGAKLSVVREPNRNLSRYTHRQALLELLSDPSLPEQLSTKQVGDRLGVVWGDISGKVNNEETRMMLKALGWTYVSRKGPSGSVFRRLEPAQEQELDRGLSNPSVAEEDHSRMPSKAGKAHDDVEELPRQRRRLISVLRAWNRVRPDRWDF